MNQTQGQPCQIAPSPCQEPVQPQESAYSIPQLIKALDQRYQEELKIKDANAENIENLGRILEALRAIP